MLRRDFYTFFLNRLTLNLLKTTIVALPSNASKWEMGFNSAIKGSKQCFSTAGPRPGTGPWHQLYRAARDLNKLKYTTRFH